MEIPWWRSRRGLGPAQRWTISGDSPIYRAFERVPKGALFRPDTPSDAAERRSGPDKEFCVQVLVRDNNIDQALKALKKKMQREGIFREMKLRGHYEKPSEKRAREKAEAVRRARKLARKKLQREGLLPMKPKPVMGAR
jgi:small subunit ribosomal protein S21